MRFFLRERPPKTFVIGAQGYIGNALFKAYQNYYYDIFGSHHYKTASCKKFDLVNPDLDFLELPVGEYTYAVISAGVTNITVCEKDPLHTYQINVLGIIRLTEQLLQKKITPILFSSDYVFDGTEDFYNENSSLKPLNVYGSQKAALERELIRNFNGEFLLLRLSKVFGLHKGDETLIDQMANSLINQKYIRVAKDQIFCPIVIDDLLEVIFRLQKIGARGVFNVCGNESWSRWKIAQAVCNALHADEKFIQPIFLDDLSEPFLRPKRLIIRNHKVCETTGIQLQSLDDSIQVIAHQYINCCEN